MKFTTINETTDLRNALESKIAHMSKSVIDLADYFVKVFWETNGSGSKDDMLVYYDLKNESLEGLKNIYGIKLDKYDDNAILDAQTAALIQILIMEYDEDNVSDIIEDRGFYETDEWVDTETKRFLNV